MPAGGGARLAVADILRAHAGENLSRGGAAAGPHERQTLARLVSCGTAALGGHAWQCDHGAAAKFDYNSCRDRFCPSCGGAKRPAWFDQLASSLLPTPHFQLVFTLPRELSSLILANRRELYGFLFRAAADCRWMASGAAISDGRLLEHRDGQVTFRAKNYRQGRRHVTLRLSGVEFTRRFALHILPSGLARVRRCGLMAAPCLTGRQARALLPISAAPQALATPPSPTDDSASEPPRCPRCERGRLRLVKVIPQPARRALLAKSGLALPPHDSCPDTS